MTTNNKYYLIHSQNTGNYPMMVGKTIPKLKYLYSDNFRNASGELQLINNRVECQLAPEKYTYEINLAEPIPKNPEFVDFHMYDLEQSVSEKFVKTFEGFPGVQFLQATNGGVVDQLNLNYFYLHYLYSIKCMDVERSEADMIDDWIVDYEKLVLDENILENIPEEQRLIFWLREDPMTCIVHQKFVDKYNEAGLKGARFVPIEQYNEETAFM